MKFTIDGLRIPTTLPTIGAVYGSAGGYGRKAGHMMIVVGIKDHTAYLLVVDREGEIVGVTQYGVHSLEERMPIAYCPEMETLTFNIRSI